LDELLGGGVEVAGGRRRDHDALILEDHLGDRHTLLLAAVEPVAAFTDDRVVAVG